MTLVEKKNEFAPSLSIDIQYGVAFFRRRISLCTAVSGYILTDEFSRTEVDPDTYVCGDLKENVTSTESYSIRPVADLRIMPSYSPNRFRFYQISGLHVYSVSHERIEESTLADRRSRPIMKSVTDSDSSENYHLNWFFGAGIGVKIIFGEIGVEVNVEEDALRGRVQWSYVFYP